MHRNYDAQWNCDASVSVCLRRPGFCLLPGKAAEYALEGNLGSFQEFQLLGKRWQRGYMSAVWAPVLALPPVFGQNLAIVVLVGFIL